MPCKRIQWRGILIHQGIVIKLTVASLTTRIWRDHSDARFDERFMDVYAGPQEVLACADRGRHGVTGCSADCCSGLSGCAVYLHVVLVEMET